MKLYSWTTVSLCIGTSSAFAPVGIKPKAAFALKASFDGADSLLNKLDPTSLGKAVESSVKAVQETVAPAVEEAVAPVVEKAEVVTKAAVEVAVPSVPDITPPSMPEISMPEISMPEIDMSALGGGGDLPLPLIAGGLVVLAGVAALVSGGGSDDAAEATTSAPAPAPSAGTTDDVSIPYDAAAKLAYEEAGKPGDFESFKAKYEADAAAEAAEKKKERDSN